ncbi:GNAT family N-acetyltransferase [Enterococcus faecium]|uniref:GNAT family N-acetyltransferase n=1 Tax=Enterococcus faecium TaxID=1352 RepID=UPI000CF20651|nr:GNAT family N-acetyltransferase [Enterococcus faecium]EGP5055665.1 N-acetyltransferase [Enterococcus faecium]EGP5210898.1 N-acetyltransferase [Enterococcus faecium]MDN3077950.1 GNAT family N-acetyltransferase [Enterococcus faecium]MDQ8231212.1 GNAT family N-acetyltransferase [Enterococcus faecium]MDQ8238714.1 GNAT family N-acetyltransferase [Enterococcus faecium]
MEIKEEKNRLALFNDEQQEIGEMTWSDVGPDIMIIDHTFVDPAYRGQKLAEKLVYTGVELARRDGKKIIPLCPYAKKEFEKKPEYQDVLRQS